MSLDSTPAPSGGQLGFWSYTHRDNELVDGAIATLASKVENAFELLAGQKLPLFHDRDALSWGEKWKERIDSALAQTTFFIPIITPLYFASQECRRELSEFAKLAKELGREGLILPIYYAPVDGLESESSDQLKALISEMQREDWRETRLREMTSEEHRIKVNKLAERLLEIVNRDAAIDDVASTVAPAKRMAPVIEVDEDAPGYLETMIDGKDMLDRAAEALERFAAKQRDITDVVDGHSDQMDAASSLGPKAMSDVAKQTAYAITPGIADLQQLGEGVAASLSTADSVVRVMLEMAADQDTGSRDDSIRLLNSIAAMDTESAAAEVSNQGLAEVLDRTAKMSRHLRGPLGRMKDAYSNLSDSRQYTAAWGVEARRILREVYDEEPSDSE